MTKVPPQPTPAPTPVCPECGRPACPHIAEVARRLGARRFGWCAVFVAFVVIAIANVHTMRHSQRENDVMAASAVIGHGVTLAELRAAAMADDPANLGIQQSIETLLNSPAPISRDATLRLAPILRSGSLISNRFYGYPFSVLHSHSSTQFKNLRDRSEAKIHPRSSPSRWYEGMYVWSSNATRWILVLPGIAAWLCLGFISYWIVRAVISGIERRREHPIHRRVLITRAFPVCCIACCAIIGARFDSSTVEQFDIFGSFRPSPFDEQRVLKSGLTREQLASSLAEPFNETAWAKDIVRRFDQADFTPVTRVLDRNDSVIQLKLEMVSDTNQSTWNRVTLNWPLEWFIGEQYAGLSPGAPVDLVAWNGPATLRCSFKTSTDGTGRIILSLFTGPFAVILLMHIAAFYFVRIPHHIFFIRRLHHRQKHNLCPHCAYPIPTPHASVNA